MCRRLTPALLHAPTHTLAAGAAAAAQHIAVVAVISKGFSNLAAAGTEQFDAQRLARTLTLTLALALTLAQP